MTGAVVIGPGARRREATPTQTQKHTQTSRGGKRDTKEDRKTLGLRKAVKSEILNIFVNTSSSYFSTTLCLFSKTSCEEHSYNALWGYS